MFRFEKRLAPSRAWVIGAPLVAVLATMVIGGIMFWAIGINPADAIRMIFWDPIFGEFAFYYRPQLLVKAAPLILIALGLSIGFRAGIWNIGAEGQYIIGALCAAGVALAFYPNEGWYIFPLMIIAGGLGGFLWAMIPAILRIKFRTNEILVSLMLVYVAQFIQSSMAQGLLRNPEGMGFHGSRNLQKYPAAHNAEIFAGTNIHWGVIAAVLMVGATYVLMNRHMLGFQIRLTGESERAARFSGVRPNVLIMFCLGASGAVAGLAGMFEVSGPSGQISHSFNANYGFTAIIVAYLGRLNPFGIVAAGFLLALTFIGGDLAQGEVNLPSSAIKAFQGLLLFAILAMNVFTNYRLKFGQSEGA